MTPKRIQLSRKRGWRKPPNTVNVARPSKWGNPFKIVPGVYSAEDAVADYRRWLVEHHDGQMVAALAPVELRGKDLACWCSLANGTFCHADELLRIANADG